MSFDILILKPKKKLSDDQIKELMGYEEMDYVDLYKQIKQVKSSDVEKLENELREKFPIIDEDESFWHTDPTLSYKDLAISTLNVSFDISKDDIIFLYEFLFDNGYIVYDPQSDMVFRGKDLEIVKSISKGFFNFWILPAIKFLAGALISMVVVYLIFEIIKYIN